MFRGGSGKINMDELHDSEEICEALVRYVEMTGSECFEKNFIMPDGNIKCTVWCIIGENSQSFRDMIREWLDKHGFIED